MTGMAHLRCEAIAKSFGARTVLRDVDVEVAEGTMTAILGSSGSGKTTLLRVIIGFIAPDAGTVTIAGSIVAGGGRKPVAPDKRAVGYVAQEGALYPHLSVGENIGFEANVLADAQMGVESALLGDVADGAFVGGHRLAAAAGHDRACDRDGPGVGSDEPDDHSQQRGLAAAGRAEDRRHRPLGDLDVDVTQHRPRAERLRDRLASQVRHAGHVPSIARTRPKRPISR